MESPAFEMMKAWPEERLSYWTELQNGCDFKAGSVLGWGTGADVLVMSIPA